MFAIGLPVRGALAHGTADYIPGTNHLVGDAVLRAARLEKCQDWFGVAVDEEILPDDDSVSVLDEATRHVLVRYDPPMKPEVRTVLQPRWVLNWRLNLIIMEGTRSLFPKPQDERQQAKLDNTLQFCKWLRDRDMTILEDPPRPWLGFHGVGLLRDRDTQWVHGDEF